MITDDFIKEMLTKARDYSVVILKAGPNENTPDRQQVAWEHVRRNFELREQGILSIVCPIFGHNEIRGIGVFNATKEDLPKIMDEDPGVKKGVFVYEVLSGKSFPGDSLPA